MAITLVIEEKNTSCSIVNHSRPLHHIEDSITKVVKFYFFMPLIYLERQNYKFIERNLLWQRHQRLQLTQTWRH